MLNKKDQLLGGIQIKHLYYMTFFATGASLVCIIFQGIFSRTLLQWQRHPWMVSSLFNRIILRTGLGLILYGLFSVKYNHSSSTSISSGLVTLDYRGLSQLIMKYVEG